MEQLLSLDIALSAPIHSLRSVGPLEFPIAVFAATFNPFVLPFVWLAGLYFTAQTVRVVFVCIAKILAVLLVTTFMKKITERPRPVLNMSRSADLMFNFRSRETNYSMPSGDSAQAALFYTFLGMNASIPLYLSALLTFLTMFSRVFYMCHYWSDTIVGAFLGSLICALSNG